MTFIDWFAGIGGFRRGMELAGHKCVGFCEFDKYAVMSYTSMHLITEEQREYLATLPMLKSTPPTRAGTAKTYKTLKNNSSDISRCV